jgi:hypothetical protein
MARVLPTATAPLPARTRRQIVWRPLVTVGTGTAGSPFALLALLRATRPPLLANPVLAASHRILAAPRVLAHQTSTATPMGMRRVLRVRQTPTRTAQALLPPASVWPVPLVMPTVTSLALLVRRAPSLLLLLPLHAQRVQITPRQSTPARPVVAWRSIGQRTTTSLRQAPTVYSARQITASNVEAATPVSPDTLVWAVRHARHNTTPSQDRVLNALGLLKSLCSTWCLPHSVSE